MADSRFFTRSGPFSLTQLAGLTGALLEGAAAAREMHDVAPLETAAADHLSFFDNVKYLDAFSTSKAGACFVRPRFVGQAPEGMALLVTDEPYTAYAKAAQLFYPDTFEPYISAHAHIAPSAQLGEGCRIEAGAWIGEGVVIGKGCRIGANTTISHAIIGDHVQIHRGVHIGTDGFGYAPSEHGLIKVPQLGRVIIGDGVEIGSNTCIDRGSGPDTVIGTGAKIDNLVQIGHNCTIGAYAVIVSQVGIAGSAHIGDGVQIGGQTGISGHITIGPRARIAAQSGVMRDIPTGETFGGSPAVPVKEWHRQTAALAQLTKRKGEK